MKRMTTRAQASHTSAAARAAPVEWQLSPAMLWRTWAVLGWAATFVAVWLALAWLRAYTDRELSAVPLRIEWASLPVWLSTAGNRPVLDEIQAMVTPPPETRLQDPQLVELVATRLSRSPWVASVDRVTRRSDGVVTVRATFREPAAFVVQRGRGYLVDTEGTRLPWDYAVSELDPTHHYLIEGVAAGPPEIGQPWPGEDIRGGLALVAFLRTASSPGGLGVPFRPLLKAIDVSNFHGKANRFDGKLRIPILHPGAYVDWGLPPGQEPGVEASAVRKLENLRTIYTQLNGQFPDKIIDVRWPDGVQYRPVRSAPAADAGPTRKEPSADAGSDSKPKARPKREIIRPDPQNPPLPPPNTGGAAAPGTNPPRGSGRR